MLRFVLSILFLSLVWFLACWLDLNHQNLGFGILWKRHSLNSLIFSLTRETDTQEKLSNFEKLQSLNDKIPVLQKKLFAIWQNWCFGHFYHLGIEVLQNFSASFCLSFSHEKKIWGNERIYFSENLNLAVFSVKDILKQGGSHDTSTNVYKMSSFSIHFWIFPVGYKYIHNIIIIKAVGLQI